MSKKQMAPEEVRQALVAAELYFDGVRRLYAEEVRNHRKLVAAIRETCPHDWRHVYDPSGGSDSADICNICGVEK